jgi:hypothetical protein
VLPLDPFKPVMFKVLISMPDRYRMPPHFHATDEQPWGVFPYGY